MKMCENVKENKKKHCDMEKKSHWSSFLSIRCKDWHTNISGFLKIYSCGVSKSHLSRFKCQLSAPSPSFPLLCSSFHPSFPGHHFTVLIQTAEHQKGEWNECKREWGRSVNCHQGARALLYCIFSGTSTLLSTAFSWEKSILLGASFVWPANLPACTQCSIDFSKFAEKKN